MNIVAAADNHWAIGNQGQKLVSIPEDQRILREETLGKVIVMSRKTLEQFPGKQPLYGRTNLILTRDENYAVKGGLVCNSMNQALRELEQFDSRDIFIIGGQSIYEQFLPYCDTAHITAIDYEYNADRYMPNLDMDPDWSMTEESEEQTYFDLCYTFRLYRKTVIY